MNYAILAIAALTIGLLASCKEETPGAKIDKAIESGSATADKAASDASKAVEGLGK